MNEYLYEIDFQRENNLSDEEMMIVVANKKLQTNRKEKIQKESRKYGKESHYDFYC